MTSSRERVCRLGSPKEPTHRPVTTMMTEPEQILRLRDDAVPWREVDGEIVALDGPTSQYVSINGSGSILWQELAAGTSAKRLTELLVARYGIHAERATADVEAFLSQLDARNWLTKSP
jgi:hypothetical protein